MDKGTPLGNVRGLGPSHSGAHHWLLERLSGAIALLPIIFLLVSLLLLPDLSFATVREWIAGPVPALAVAALVLASLWHNRLGLRVFIEDYVHTASNRLAVFLLLDLATFAAGLFAIYCLVRLAMGGAT